MVKLRSLFTALCLLATLPTLASAQAQRRVTGRVTAQGGTDPLPGASVQVVGTQIGQYTDDQGRFSVLVPAGPQEIRVRRIGYRAQVLPIAADQTELNVALVKDVLQLEAQVVTGAATSVARQNVATDIAVVNTDELNRVPTPTIENALQGKVAGAVISANSGAPGGGMQVRLRGVTSIYGASDPLYVIDGVLLSNDVVQSGINAVGQASTANVNSTSQDNGVNRVADLNPADIESIEILKGSSASAIYGAKAANGVIVIKTKVGRAGRTEFNVTQRVGTFDLANKIGSRRFSLDEAYAYNDVYEVLDDSAAVLASYNSCGGYCDFEEEVFGRNDLAYETNLSIRGGSQTTRYFASGLVKRDPGIAQNTGYNKQSLRLNLQQVASQRLTVNLTSNLVHALTRRGISNNDNANVTPYFVFGQVPSFVDFRARNGEYPARGVGSNPLQTFALLDTPEETWRLIGSVNTTYNLLASDQQNLDLNVVAGIDQFSQSANIFSPRELQYEPNDGLPGTNTALSYNNVNANYSANLTHAFSAASKAFSATTSLGMQRELRSLRGTNIVGQNCTSGLRNIDACTVRNTFANRQEVRDLAWYGQEELLTLDERLLLTAAVRGQRSTVNGDINKFYIFPKASASFRMPTFTSRVDELKLRVATGRAGNQPLYVMKYTPAISSNYDGSAAITGGGIQGDPNIRPEISNEVEAGFDLAAFDSRASLNFSVFQKNVSDVILRPVPAPSAGGYTQRYLNGGKFRNRGIEAALALTPVDRNEFTWVNRTTFSRTVGLVTELPSFVPSTGFTIPGSFGYGNYTVREGFAPTIILGPDSTGATVEYGNTQPDFNIGFSNELSWKRLRMSTLFDWQKGGDIINITQDVYDIFELAPDRAASIERQRQQADYNITKENVQDGSFVKLREVTLSYELPVAFSQRLFSSRARTVRAELSGRNLLTWTDYKGVDPEVSNFGNQNITRNADLAPFPPARSYFFSLSVDF
jgi:TonB-linked SusC/RagA family outer membrane protein